MDLGASRYFGSVIHEFAQSIGKDNFYLIGEITGGRQRAFQTLETTGLDAALGVDDIPDKVEYLVKGFRNPEDYFSLFRNSLLVQKESHIWFRNKVVTMFDDHDQVRKGENKARFCADAGADRLVVNALALNATTLGIPCVYYGTEQAFDGRGRSDQFLRETMFGGEYGAFQSRGRHFFREDGIVYQELSRVLRVRRAETGVATRTAVPAPDLGQRRRFRRAAGSSATTSAPSSHGRGFWTRPNCSSRSTPMPRSRARRG